MDHVDLDYWLQHGQACMLPEPDIRGQAYFPQILSELLNELATLRRITTAPTEAAHGTPQLTQLARPISLTISWSQASQSLVQESHEPKSANGCKINVLAFFK
jgi:hypothetical protein